MWIWDSEAAVDTEEYGWARIRGRHSNTQLLWVSVIFDNYLIFTYIHET